MKPLRTIQVIATVAALLFLAFLFAGGSVWMQTQWDMDRIHGNVVTINQMRGMISTFGQMESTMPDIFMSGKETATKQDWDALFHNYLQLDESVFWGKDRDTRFSRLLDSCDIFVRLADSQMVAALLPGKSTLSEVEAQSGILRALAHARGHIIDAIQEIRYDQAMISMGLSTRWHYVLSLFVFGAVVGIGAAISSSVLAQKLKGAREEGRDWLHHGQHFQRLFDEASVGIVLFRMNGLGVVQANRAFCGLIGFSEEALKEQNLQAISHQEDYTHEMNLLDKVLASQITSYQTERRFIGKDGQEIWTSVTSTILLDESSEPESVLMIVEDITRRRLAEQERLNSEERYRLIAENSSDMIVKADHEGTILYVTPACRTLLGLTQTAILKRNICEFVHPEDRDIIKQSAFRIQRQRTVDTVRYRIRRSSGAYIWVETTARAIYSENHDPQIPRQMIAVTRNITQRKQYEEALQAAHIHQEQRVEERTRKLRLANKALERENKVRQETEAILKATLSERELLLKEIFHRVKNNMQVVASMLKLQSRQIEHPETARILEESQRRIESMSLIHESLYQQEHLSDIDFRAYVQRLAKHLLKTYGSDRDRPVEIDIGFDHIQINIETAIPCGLIIHELVSNALKYAFSGMEKQYRRIFVDFDKMHQGYKLIVSDNGRGIPDAHRGRDGKSFGLRLVELLVRQLNGSQVITTTNGTTFAIDLKENIYKERVYDVQ